VDGLAAEVGRAPVQGRQLGFGVAVASGPDDAAGALPGDPAALLVSFRPWGGMGDALDRVVVVGDDRPLGADAKVDPTPCSRLGVRGCWQTIAWTETTSRSPCSDRVIDNTRARPLATSRSSRLVFSLARSRPITGNTRWRRSGSRRIAPVVNRTRPRSRRRDLNAT
jgi:hypothetical protein